MKQTKKKEMMLEEKIIKCLYCSFFQEATTRINQGEDRFCNHRNKMVMSTQNICDDGFELYPFFWCQRTNQQLDIAVCAARQNKGITECNGCHTQKEIILESRRYSGCQAKESFKKRIIKKKEIIPEEPISEDSEVPVEMEKRKLLKRKVIVEPEIIKSILHRKEEKICQSDNLYLRKKLIR